MYSILVIEDDLTIIEVMESVLGSEGFAVRTASNGPDGIGMIRDVRPDLILCDIMMPGMDGYSVLETLKLNDEFSDIPFIFVTALDDRTNFRRGMSSGADDYLTKPFLAEELIAAVTGRLHRIEILRLKAERSAFREEHNFLRQHITPRELEVLLLVGQGYTSKQIATRLGIRSNTVQVHRTNVMLKLDTPNAANLARWAVIAELMLSAEP
ncbi:MAG: response regulator transcription factor [Desulfuromonadaceae bacterium]|nr:response regulator transcription factor [Desulfuromonadaceae bacterium]